ncbi:thaumatin-like protein [Andrographis paniculata]|uniref:thaumatin-like protein n=1 Tax=Andrographis paniculata TaxID=175694 RepID=UPI0021E8CDD9|nr:thaumatin-like protein [Andrographis paniculata]
MGRFNCIIFFCLIISSLTTSVFSSESTKITIANNCNGTIWPAILPTAGQPPLNGGGGFVLRRGRQESVEAPKWWSGRIWARQGCNFDNSGRGTCQTGDCDGELRCGGVSGQPPATVVDLTLGTETNPIHYYDVSLVDGFNLPVAVIPAGGSSGGCGVAACEADVNVACPERLAVRRGGKVVGCESPCLAIGEDEYCCRGAYAGRAACKPTAYARTVKAVCPRALSYAYDESRGLNTCRARRYIVTFCPPN